MGTTSSHFEESGYSPGDVSAQSVWVFGFLGFFVFYVMSILLHFKMTDSH